MLLPMRSDAINPALLDVPGGVATRAQWRAAGATKDMFRDGRLVAAGGAMYALPELLTSQMDVARLVGALAPAGAVVTGWAAALLHGVRDAGPTMQKTAGSPIQLCLDRQDNRAPRGFDVLRVTLDAGDVEVVDGVQVTTVARTAYDMVRFSHSLPTAVAALDAFRSQLSSTPVDLDELVLLQEPRPRGRGHPLLRDAVALSSDRSRSFPESRLRVRSGHALGLSPADLCANWVIQDADRRWELDLLDATSGLVIEYDSVHHADTVQRELDARKDLDLRELGLDVVRINAITLGRSNSDLAAVLGRAQRRASLSGCALAVRRLAADGVLTAPPLRIYSSAVAGGFETPPGNP